jgi:hypothetical protein
MLGSTTLIAATIFASVALAAPEDTHVASCDPGPVMIGSGSPDWRRESLDAGPIGVRHRPLREMSPYGRDERQLVTKMPILIEGHEPITVSVPPKLRHRVFLYYGFHKGGDGGRSTSFFDYPGASTVEFQPCADKPRTVWPGGIRVKGRKSVHLLVTVEGQPGPVPLRLGKPTLYTR